MSENTYFFDSYAILEILKGNIAYNNFSEIKIITTLLNFLEVYYSLLKENDKQTAQLILQKLNFHFIEIDKQLIIEVADFRFQNKALKLSYIDCIGYILAKRLNIKFLTGDKAFENLENVEFVK